MADAFVLAHVLCQQAIIGSVELWSLGKAGEEGALSNWTIAPVRGCDAVYKMGRSSLGITYNTHNLRHIRISLVLKRGGGGAAEPAKRVLHNALKQ